MGFGQRYISWFISIFLISHINVYGQSTPCHEPSQKGLKNFEKAQTTGRQTITKQNLIFSKLLKQTLNGQNHITT
jgi:hypothetical protein